MSLVAALAEQQKSQRNTCHVCGGYLRLITVTNQKSQSTGLYRCSNCKRKVAFNTEGKRL